MTYEYPPQLVALLTQREKDGSEIFVTHCEDDTTMWFIPLSGHNKFELIQWAEGELDFKSMVLSGKAVERLLTVIGEQRPN